MTANLRLRAFARARDYICPMDEIIAAIPEKGSVLDIGCGRGLLLNRLASERRGEEFVGVDIHPETIERAYRYAALFPNAGQPAPVFRVAADASMWPKGPFDTITMIDVMHHVPVGCRKEMIAAIAQRLRPGGSFVYKDMLAAPWWCGLGNRIHDLAVAREWIEYCPSDALIEAARSCALPIQKRERWRRLWYAHEMMVFRRG